MRSRPSSLPHIPRPTRSRSSFSPAHKTKTRPPISRKRMDESCRAFIRVYPWSSSLTRSKEGEDLITRPLLHLYVEPLDLLVQRRQRNFEVFGSLRLVPVTAFQAVRDDAAFNLFHHIEERGIGLMIQEACGVGASG